MSRENVKEKVSPIEGDRNREFVRRRPSSSRMPRKIADRSSLYSICIFEFLIS